MKSFLLSCFADANSSSVCLYRIISFKVLSKKLANTSPLISGLELGLSN
jgi:hypothetical protein